MEACKIIEELKALDRNLVFYGKLKTLATLVQDFRPYTALISQRSNAWRVIEIVERLLDCELDVGLFVVAKDGKPLDKPHNHDKWLSYQARGLELLFGNENENKEYNKACKFVIFDGWEVVRFDGNYLYIVNKESDIELEFNTQYITVEVNLNQSTLNNLYGSVETIGNLAVATQSNPLKFKALS